MRSHPPAILGLTILFLPLASIAGCSGDLRSDGKAAFTVRDSAGVEIVEQYVDTNRVISLVEDVRIGTVEGESDYQFFRVMAVEVDDSGNVFVLDAGNHEVRVFSAAGDLVTKWGREGDGPGEFRRPRSMALRSDTLVILDDRLVHVFTSAGELVRSFSILTTQRAYAMSVLPVDADWTLTSIQFPAVQSPETAGEQQTLIRTVDLESGTLGDVIYEFPASPKPVVVGSFGFVVRPLFYPPISVAQDRRGYIYESEGGDYTVSVYDRDSNLVRQMEMETERVRVEPWMLDEYVENWKERCGEPLQGECKMFFEEAMQTMLDLPNPEFRPVVGQVHASADGHLLVLRSDLDPHPFKSGDIPVYDLFDPAGVYLGRVDLQDRFRPTWLSAEGMAGVTWDDMDVAYVVRYRFVLSAAAEQELGKSTLGSG